MKFLNILSALADAPDNQPASRRESLAKTAALLKKAALAALPAGLGSVAFPAAAASTPEALNLLLEFKLALQQLYSQGITAATAPSTFTAPENPNINMSTGNLLSALTEVKKHTDAQVTLLTGLISGMGATPVSRTFQFSGTGANELENTFQKRSVFLAVAQLLEDALAKTALGLLPAVQGNPGHYSTVLQLLTVDSRHSALWRQGRSNTSSAPFVVPFYLGSSPESAQLPQELVNFGNANGADLLSLVYGNENNTVQAGTEVTSVTDAPDQDAAEAFDEPLPESAARTLLDLFIA